MRISDWSSDVCSSDLPPHFVSPHLSFRPSCSRRPSRGRSRWTHDLRQMRGRCPYPQTTIGRLEMKKMLMGAASVIALSIAAPAFAQSTSTVNQSNTGNGEVVDQTGSLSGGDSTVHQSGASHSDDRKSVGEGKRV